MVTEHFYEDTVGEIYRQFTDKGRMLPEGLRCIESWVAADMSVCYQLMETDDPRLFTSWIKKWDDLMSFEIVPIFPSQEERAKALSTT